MTSFQAPQPGRVAWLFVDMNSYFASVEQQDRPALRGKPVAVVPMLTDATCAIAASYEAKKFGIKTGTMIAHARALCPDLICVLARHDVYVRYHHQILSEVVRHTPIHTVWSIDELSSRLPPGKQNIAKATDVARAIKQGLARNIGPLIRCSIGLAPNSFLAKVATDMQKPDGLVVLTPETMQERLFALKLQDLPGISAAMESKLWRAGIRCVEDLWHTSPKHARAIWGNVGGERFWYNLHGYDVPERATNRSMIGHSRILDPELRRPDQARLVARRLMLKAVSRMRRQNLFAQKLDLGVRVANGPRYGGQVHLQPACDHLVFMRALDQLWAQMLKTTQPRLIKKVSVILHGLCTLQDITPDLPDLFAATVQVPPNQQRKHERLSAAIDTLNARYGAETIRLGISPRTQAGYLGTKIAFNRIPDTAEFFE